MNYKLKRRGKQKDEGVVSNVKVKVKVQVQVQVKVKVKVKVKAHHRFTS